MKDILVVILEGNVLHKADERHFDASFNEKWLSKPQ